MIYPNADIPIEQWFARRGFDFAEFSKSRYSLHRSNSDVTLDQYRCRLLHRYSNLVAKRVVVYLDLKYWINLRKVFLNQTAEPAYHELFSVLSQAVKNGIALCPLSFWIFQELLKQSDPYSRAATAKLIDILSDGVAFMSHGEIACQEILHFIRKASPSYSNVEPWPIKECIWTRTMSFLGDRIPFWQEADIHASDQLLVQKSWEDFHFFLPLEDMISNIDTVPSELLYSGYDVDAINGRKKQVRQEHSSFKSLFLAELMHTIKENEQHWYETMAYLYFLESGVLEHVNCETMTEEEKRPARNLLWLSFKNNKITTELPSYHIPSALYSAACWDSQRKLVQNDVLDFHHAQLGIPYSDIFLTETSLKTMACSQHLRLDKIYQTKIISDPNAAVDELKLRILAAQSRPHILQELFSVNTYDRI